MRLPKFTRKIITVNSIAILLSAGAIPIVQPPYQTVHAVSSDDSGVSIWNNWGTVKWGIDENGTLWIKPQSGSTGTLGSLGYDFYAHPPWHNSQSSIKSVKLEGTIVAASGCCGLFKDLNNCRDMDLTSLDTSKATNMNTMFCGCSSLTNLDVSNWNTSDVSDMTGMFDGCYSLTNLDVSKWDTNKVTSMTGMFNSCSRLTNLDVSKWNTGNVTDMSNMFNGCSSLVDLDVSNWNISKVMYMGGIFNGCSSLVNLNVSKWDTSSVSAMGSMFNDCSSLTNLDVSKWNTGNVTDMSNIFNGCSSLVDLDVSNWDTGNVSDMSWIFNDCSSLTNLDISKWDTSGVTNMNYMFHGCNNLANLDVSKWNTSQVTDMSMMFAECSSLANLDVSKWNTGNVTDMYYMFNKCSSLTNLDVSNWDTGKVTNMMGMFYGCSSLVSLDVSNWDTSAVTYMNMAYMFASCSKLSELKLGKGFKVPNGFYVGLPDPDKTGEYTGRWSKADGSNGMSASEMMGLTGQEHDASGKSLGKTLTQEDRAGTWIWERGYTVTLDPNGGTGSPKTFTAVLSQDQVFGKDSASVYITDPGYTKSPATFIGVSEQKDGAGMHYQYPFTYKTNNNKTLYTQWQEPTYTIKFDAGFGSGSMADETMTRGSSKTLSKNTFTKNMYEFAGWNTKKDGTGEFFADQQSVLDIAAAGETVTLYAQWKKASWYDPGMSKTDPSDNNKHDPDSYIVTIPTAISFIKMNAGIVNQNVSFVTNVTGNIADGKSVKVTPDATTSLVGRAGSLKVAVKQAKSAWSSLDVYGNSNSDGSRTGTDTTTTVNISGEAKSSDIYRGTIGFNVQLVDNVKYDYDYTGSIQTFTAPKTGSYLLETWGAQSGGYVADGNYYKSYAPGGYAAGSIDLTKGDKLYIAVGGKGTDATYSSTDSVHGKGGWNGGGDGSDDAEDVSTQSESLGGGGGATSIATSLINDGQLSNYAASQNKVLLVAGGAGSQTRGPDGMMYGSGGGTNGNIGLVSSLSYNYIKGAYVESSTQSAGYAFGQGENGNDNTMVNHEAGGGGGGWYGGRTNTKYQYGGASGGSGYVSPLLTNGKMWQYLAQVTNSATASTSSKSEEPNSMVAKFGNGHARISYLG